MRGSVSTGQWAGAGCRRRSASGRSTDHRRQGLYLGRRSSRRIELRPGSRRWRRYAVAGQLQAALPALFARQRPSAIAHAVATVVNAGWTVEDIRLHLDARPLPLVDDPESPDGVTAQVRHPARWLAHRLAGANPATRPTTTRAAAAAARAEQARVHQHAARAAAAIGRGGSRPPHSAGRC